MTMSPKNKDYWNSLEHRDELRSGVTKSMSATSAMPVAEKASVDRRDFLKLSGFAIGAGALTGCIRGKEREVVPYLQATEEVVPGRASWYASVCGACPAGCGILARSLDGRPVKLEGNPDHPISSGGLCAMGQASVLGLYDSKRLHGPLDGESEASWSDIDQKIGAGLAKAASAGGRVRFLTDSTTGPAERAAIGNFLGDFADGRLVTYDPISLSAIADAHGETHGSRILPRYRIDRAEVIVSLGADFLGRWISPVEHTKAYRAGRQLDSKGAKFSRHIQLESRMTLTGSNADRRVAIPLASSASILVHLADRIARDRGVATTWGALPATPVEKTLVEEIARELLGAHRGRALVLCGSNDIAAQRLTNFINELLGSYDSEGTIDLERGSSQRLGSDGELMALLEELRAGTVDALFIRGVNPVYDLPFGEELASLLDGLGLVVSLAERLDETARHAHLVCPEPHYLESWGDSEPAAGIVALRQPVIRVLGKTRSLLEDLSTWSGQPQGSRDLLRSHWQEQIYPRASGVGSFDTFWNKTLHDGWAEIAAAPSSSEATDEEGGEMGEATEEGFSATAVTLPDVAPGLEDGDLIAEVYASASVFDGRHAHNPWLLELPDPITKTTWDNFASISAATASSLGVEDADEVEIELESGSKILLPALVQPGQHRGTLALALGWGRLGTDRFAKVGPQWLEGKASVDQGQQVGSNVASLIGFGSGVLDYASRRVKVRKTGKKRAFACTQQHHSLFVPEHIAIPGHERRPIVRETTLAALHDDGHDDGHEGGHREHPSLYEDHEMKPHHWGMAIDLTACTGCSACVISCQAENNIPVVGRDEVQRQREMHWMRIDRYYADHGDEVDVVHMPMLCQHCDHAPCENVCPVQATVQSAEGLNQQVYNRCVGTRYCANNCPYKVRRFNWFDYPHEDRLQNMVFNPDVVVRSRGVMEKCSFCVQRIQEAKSEAKVAGVALTDGKIETACAQSCPADAIVFGDTNDPESRLSQTRKDQRHYLVLEELGVKPVVGYLAKVRNRTERSESDEHA